MSSLEVEHEDHHLGPFVPITDEQAALLDPSLVYPIYKLGQPLKYQAPERALKSLVPFAVGGGAETSANDSP